MKTGIYWQDPKYALRPGRDFIFDPSLVLYLPLGKLDGASFMSKEARGHLCSVTGALWTPQGRDFDGTDDDIDLGSGVSLDFADQVAWTFEFWAYPYSASWDVFIGGTGSEFIMFHANNTLRFRSATSAYTSSANGFVALNAWEHFVIAVDTSRNMLLYKSGQYIQTLSPDTTEFTFDYLARWTGFYWGKLKIGEVRIYNRALTPLEIQGNYLATKRRYQ